MRKFILSPPRDIIEVVELIEALHASPLRFFVSSSSDVSWQSDPESARVAYDYRWIEIHRERSSIMPNATLITWLNMHIFDDAVHLSDSISEDFELFQRASYRQNQFATYEFYVWDGIEALLISSNAILPAFPAHIAFKEME